jgi:hypothetical protein
MNLDTERQIDEIFSRIQVFNTTHVNNSLSINEAKAQLSRIVREARIAENDRWIDLCERMATMPAVHIDTLKERNAALKQELKGDTTHAPETE